MTAVSTLSRFHIKPKDLQHGLLQTKKVFAQRRNQYLLSFGVLAVLCVASSILTSFDPLQALASFPKAIGWMAANLVPTQKSLLYLPKILEKLNETVLVSILAATDAGVLAFLSAILGAGCTRPHPLFQPLVRLVASFFRNIPVAAWAMIFLFSFGQSAFTGFLALGLETYGFLVRAFVETIDETAGQSVEALRASGASWWHIVFQAVLPAAMPQVTSWMLYMVETNIRSATLVGLLTGSGIGFQFDLYYKSLNYGAAALVVVSIVVVVVSVELLSTLVRRSVL